MSEVLINFGLSLENIFLPFLFIILPFLSFTIPMSFMFAVFIAFSRLSSDGEYAGLLAAGYSLARALVPVAICGFVLFVVAALMTAYLEPWGRREFVQFYHRKAQTELDNLVRYKLQPGVFVDNFLGYVLYAETISDDRSKLENVMLAPDKSAPAEDAFTLLAPSGSVTGTVEKGDLKLSFNYGIVYATTPTSSGSTVMRFKRAELDILRIFQDQILGADQSKQDYRSFGPKKLSEYILELRHEVGSIRYKNHYRKAWYLFHRRIGLPFATLTLALFAMILGVQDPRGSKNSAWFGVILAIILSYVLVEFFRWLAVEGHLGAPWAAWLPNVLLLTTGLFLVWQKNRLPPSESVLNPRYYPLLRRFYEGRP